MRKKAIIVAVCLVLVGFLAVNGTWAQGLENIFKNIASIKDSAPETDETLLNVELVFQDRNGAPLNSPTLYPVHCADDYDWATKEQTISFGTFPLWDTAEAAGALDHFVRVHNTLTTDGAKDACFRLVFAVDANIYGKMMLNFNQDSAFQWSDWRSVTIAGRPYQMIIATYQNALKPGELSPPALLQVAMRGDVSNADLAKLDTHFLRTMVLAVDADTLTGEDGIRPDVNETLNAALPINEPSFNPF